MQKIRIIKTVKIYLILSILVTFGCVGCLESLKGAKDDRVQTGSSGYSRPILIPNATITLDGNITDWNSGALSLNDSQNDYLSAYTGTGADIKSLYIAKDSSNLYVRMDLWDNANTNFWNYPPPNNGCYRLMVDCNGPYRNFGIGIAYNNSLGRWEMGYNGANSSSVPSGLQGPAFVGVSGGVIEIKIPLSNLGNPTEFYEFNGKTVMISSTGGPYTVIDEARFRAPVTIEGYVYLNGTTTPVVGATIGTSLDSRVATTNQSGHFNLQTNTQPNYSTTPYTININAGGYQNFSQTNSWGDYPINQRFYLVP